MADDLAAADDTAAPTSGGPARASTAAPAGDLARRKPPSPGVAGATAVWGSRWRASKPFVVAVAFLGVFTDMAVYSIVMPFIVDSLGGNTLGTGMLLLVYALGVVLSAPFFGYFADRWQNKRMPMIYGLLALLAAIIVMPVARAYWLLAVARFLQGVTVADIYHSEPIGFAQAMSYIMIGYTLGTVIGPPIGGALYGLYAPSPFIFCGALVLLDLIGRILVIEPQVESVDDLSALSASSAPASTVETATAAPVAEDGEPAAFVCATEDESMGGLSKHALDAEKQGGEFVVVELATAPTVADSKPNFVSLLRSPPLLMVLGLTVVAGVVLTSPEPTLPTWLNEVYGMNTTQVGLVMLALVIPPVFISPVLGYIVDHYGSYPLLPIGVILASPAQILPGFMINHSLVWTIAALCIMSALMSIALMPLIPEIAACVLRSAYSKAYSMFNMAWSSGILLG
ncbi:hypothetical protein HK405_012176, partial [Cladochytrium tenue]